MDELLLERNPSCLTDIESGRYCQGSLAETVEMSKLRRGRKPQISLQETCEEGSSEVIPSTIITTHPALKFSCVDVKEGRKQNRISFPCEGNVKSEIMIEKLD